MVVVVSGWQVGQQFSKDHGANYQVAQLQRNRRARRISMVRDARLFADFSHNCARIPIIFAQKKFILLKML